MTVCSEKGDTLAGRLEAHRVVHAYRVWRDANPGAGRYLARRRVTPARYGVGTRHERTGPLEGSYVERQAQFSCSSQAGAAWAEFPIGHLFNFEIIWQVFRAALLSHRTINNWITAVRMSEVSEMGSSDIRTQWMSDVRMSDRPIRSDGSDTDERLNHSLRGLREFMSELELRSNRARGA